MTGSFNISAKVGDPAVVVRSTPARLRKARILRRQCIRAVEIERSLKDARPTPVAVKVLPIAAEADAMRAFLPVDVFIDLIGAQEAVLGNVVVIANRQSKPADARPVQVEAVKRVAAFRNWAGAAGC